MLGTCKFIHDSQLARTPVRFKATVGRICIKSPTTVSTAETGWIPVKGRCGRSFMKRKVNP